MKLFPELPDQVALVEEAGFGRYRRHLPVAGFQKLARTVRSALPDVFHRRHAYGYSEHPAEMILRKSSDPGQNGARQGLLEMSLDVFCDSQEPRIRETVFVR